MFKSYFLDSLAAPKEGEPRWAFATVEDFHRAFRLLRYAMSCHSGRKFPEFGKKKAAPVRYLTDEELTGILSSSSDQSRATVMKDMRQQLDLLEKHKGLFPPMPNSKLSVKQKRKLTTSQLTE
jgi:hypothetical protein